MSEESAPKLRLKPKLVSDPAATPPQPAGSTPTPEPSPAPAATPVADEPKSIRLKPRLSAYPMQETAPARAPAPEPVAAEIPAPAAEPVAPEPPPTEAPAAEKPAMKFSLKPKGASAAPVPVPTDVPVLADAPAPDATTVAPPPLSGPVPAPVITDSEEEGEPAEITAIHKASSMPFPPPGKFPPPGAAKPAAPWAKPAPAGGSKKKLILMGGGALAVLLVFGGAFYTYKKLTAELPPPPPRQKLVAKPVAPQGEAAAVQTAVEKAKEQAAAPVNEVLQADQATAVPATVKPVAPPASIAVTPVVESPPPPPPASAAFKAWAENLKIGGVSVRAGKPVRITIGRTAYVTGDLVNPQLGITFESYKPETRMLTFSDKTGAKVERRN